MVVLYLPALPTRPQRARPHTHTQQLSDALYKWSQAYYNVSTMYHRAFPLAKEAVDVVRPPKDGDQARLMLMPLISAADSLSQLGRFEEAELMYLELIQFQRMTGAGHVWSHIDLADVNVWMGRWEPALAYALEARRLWEATLQHDDEARMHIAPILADCYEALGRAAECGREHDAILAIADETGVFHVEAEIGWRRREATWCLDKGDTLGAVLALQPLAEWYVETQRRGFAMYSLQTPRVTALLRLLVRAMRAEGDDALAATLEADLDETDAIFRGISQAALAELQSELRAERGAGAAAAGGGADGCGAAAGAGNKKLTRKQQVLSDSISKTKERKDTQSTTQWFSFIVHFFFSFARLCRPVSLRSNLCSIAPVPSLSLPAGPANERQANKSQNVARTPFPHAHSLRNS